MADVQIDEGNFTQIANVLLEKISGAKLNGCQFSIVLMVWRYTYGFKRKEHELSSGFIAKGTGYNKRQVEREISKLLERNIIFQKVINGVSRTLSFNKDFDTWTTPGELADGKYTDGKYTDGELVPKPPADKPMVTPGELADQEINSFKQNKEITTTTVPEITLDKVHTKVFGTMCMNGLMSEFVRDVKSRGYTDSFLIELMLETGESASKPSLRLMQTIFERWSKESIYTRLDAKNRKQQSTQRHYKTGSEIEAERAQKAAEQRKKTNVVEFQLEPEFKVIARG